MAYVKADTVINQVKAGFPYWEVKPSGGSAPMFIQQAEMSAEDSAERLQEAFEQIDGGTVVVKLSTKSKAEKARGGRTVDNLEYRVKLSGGVEAMPLAGHYAAADDSDEVTALKLQIKDMEWQKKLDDLERKLSEDRNPVMGLLENPQIQMALGTIMQKHFGGAGKVPVQGNPVNGTQEETEQLEQAERIEAACLQLMEIDENFADTIETLAKFASQNPDQYKAFIPTLKSMVQ